MRWFVMLLSLTILTGCSAPDVALPNLAQQTYAGAREKLRDAGYEPVIFACTSSDVLCASDEGLTRTYPELVDCAGTGERPCLFGWRNGERYLVVTTFGEGKIMVASAAPAAKAEIQKHWAARARVSPPQ